MKCLFGALALVAACTYEPPTGREPADQNDPNDNQPPDDDQHLQGECFATDSLLCLEFERPDSMTSALALDGSGNEFHATRTDVGDSFRFLVPAVPDDDAVFFGPSGKLTIDHELGLEGNVTVELWALTTTNPRLFDSSSRIYLSRNSEGQLECGLNNDDDFSVDGGNLDGGWHHLACTYETASKLLKVWVDGSVKDCKKLDGGIDASRTGTTTMNAGLGGNLDRVHAYSRTLTPGEICAQAGRTNCNAQCPVDNDGPGGGFPGGGGS